MSEFKVRLGGVNGSASQNDAIARELSSISGEVASLKNHLRFQIAQRSRIERRLAAQGSTISDTGKKVKWASSVLRDTAKEYRRTETGLCETDERTTHQNQAQQIAVQMDSEVRKKYDTFVEEFFSNYGWKELLEGSGYIGTIYNFIEDIKNGKTWRDFTKTGVDIYEFLNGAVKTFHDYKKIGNAVGNKTAMAWWAKSITGLKPLGRASSAQNPITRFCNNLTNKTSPFHAQFKNIIDNFKGANGAKAAIASWAAVAVDGVVNYFDNLEEQANSNGTMSNERVIAETIMETAVGTALTYGTSIVVGAAVTAALGTVAAPGVVVVAVSGVIVAGLNAGVKALTGKTTTEWASDTILDAGKEIGKAIKNISQSVGNWFGRFSFA